MSVAVLQGRRIHIRGTVQGVGFRPWVHRLAFRLGVTGQVRNDSSGVVIEAFGDSDTLRRFISRLHGEGPPAAHIDTLVATEIEPLDVPAFSIVDSQRSADRVVSIPPDLATCDDCVAEIFDPQNRRFRYPFTNCTNCGPRFTIATDIPYDRVATTMSRFAMCEACRREYQDPGDRRFHAQPNACPVCGPRLTLHTCEGHPITVPDPIAAAAEILHCGLIVAVKGIGGFHLACDATYADAVAELRRRKRRDEKPFAVMVPNLAAAEKLADLRDEERRLLTSIERPIVLAKARDNAPLALNVAPHNRLVGLFLPYSPLHHLLLADTGRPLVMTSANLSDEPIVFTNAEAVAKLGSIADVLLLHDRDIQTRCDDSVTSVIARAPVVLRRSRGHVPNAIHTHTAFSSPVLACGALLKNTFSVASGMSVWAGPHIGDLENLETYDAYVDTIDRVLRFLRVTPEVVAYDMHPDYLSTRYALDRRERTKVAVQHHHAHVASVMAEHGIDGPVVGVAYDGTGYGSDGTMWGGEILIADLASFRRVATFRPIALVGGDRAIRDPWRIAYVLLLDAFGEIPPGARPLFAGVDDHDLEFFHTVICHQFQTPMAHGVGRYFDGFGALFLNRPHSNYEGQIALEWNQVAANGVEKSYPFDVDESTDPWQLDFRPMTRQAIDDYSHGTPVPVIAAAFHNTIADATATIVRRVEAMHGPMPVVASGGCFQTALLAEAIERALGRDVDLRRNRQIPPGDGGIAVGQAVVADAVLKQQKEPEASAERRVGLKECEASFREHAASAFRRTSGGPAEAGSHDDGGSDDDVSWRPWFGY